jgi:thiol-disulfide isomerase/thioredoxin
MKPPTILVLLLLAAAQGAFGKDLPTIDPVDALARPGPIARGDDADAARLIGMKAPELPELRWLDGRSHSLETLTGKVVVIRSFTNECPFCASTMPSLQALSQRYKDRDVVVLGVYHPKPPAHVASKDVASFAKSLSITFPVAVDEDWSLVTRWWKDYSAGSWTSITWVLDREGTIRAVHPGGEYHEGGGAEHTRCRADLAELNRTIDKLLAGDPQSP